MKQRYPWGRALTAVIALYHIVLGLALLFSGELAITLVRLLGGITVTASPEMGVVGEIVGCYILAFGLMMVFVTMDPVRNRNLMTVALTLFVLRLLQRVWFASKTMSILGIEPSSYWPMAIAVAAFTVALGAFRVQIARDQKRTTASAV